MLHRDFSLVRAFQITGEWWIREKPEKRVHGRLDFDPDSGLSLQLDGSLGSIDLNTWVPIQVAGYSNDGIGILLDQCTIRSYSLRSAGEVNESTLEAGVAYVGVNLTTTEEIKFKKLSIQYAYLTDWVDRTGFNIGYERFDEGEYTVKYVPQEPVKAKVGDYEISVYLAPLSLPGYSHRMELEEEARMEISVADEKPFYDFWQVVRDVQTFLTLAMNRATYPTRIGGMGEATKQSRDGAQEYYEMAWIIYQLPFPPKEIGRLSRHETLFTLQEIQGNFESYIGNWLNRADLLRPVYELFCSCFENPFQFRESAFLNLVFALETYHRRKFQDKYEPDESYMNKLYKLLVDAIPDDLDDDFKESLVKGKLRYANEFSFATRLKKIIANLPNNLNIPAFRSPGTRDLFIGITKDTRNYYVHYDESLKGRIATGATFSYLIDILACVMRIVFMQELGMNDDQVSLFVVPATKLVFRRLYEPVLIPSVRASD